MSKRYQPTNNFGHCLKKPKYDININKDRTLLPPTQTRNNHVSPLKSSLSSYWDDDDDDDVILLATQVAEAAAVAKDKGHQYITDSEITFSEFAKVGGSSTQNPQIPSNDILSQMFDDDDDFELLAAVQKQDPGVFKKPAAPLPRSTQPAVQHQPNSTRPSEEAHSSAAATQPLSEFLLSQSSGPNCTLPSTQSAARRQLASERQIKFLMEKMELLKKENSNLSKSLSESKSKIESKEGETKLLRDELKHLKQQVQNLKMEKIFSTEAAKTESQNKIKELTKQVEGKEAELKLKEVQCSKMKMRLADESHKLQQSICQESIRQVQVKKRTVSTDSTAEQQQMTVQQTRFAKSLMKMQTLSLNCLKNTDFNEVSIPCVPAHTDIYVQQQGSLKKKKTVFESELEKMQTLLAELRLLGANNLPRDFKAKCTDSLRNVCQEFTSYIDTLSFQENSSVYPYHGYSLLKTKIARKLQNAREALQHPSELYDDEMAISLRRYFAGLAVICQEVACVANAMVYAEVSSGNTCLLVIFNCIDHLGYSTEICEHFGLLEAIAMWTSTLLQNATHVDDLLHLIKYIIFARPSAWVFKEISLCLYQFCYDDSKLIRCLCRVNEEESFTSDRVGSIYRFCDESCILQVRCRIINKSYSKDVPKWIGRLVLYARLAVMLEITH